MISRRNIRVKVMQAIYSLETGGQTAVPAESVKVLQKRVDQSRQLFIYLVHFILQLAGYAETDSRFRQGKHLPTEEDRNVSVKLAANELLQKIKESESYVQALKTGKPQLMLNADVVKKLYAELIETSEYRKYVATGDRDRKTEKDMLIFLFNDIMLPNELFEAHIEELFSNWHDDVDMMAQLIPAYISKPQSCDLKEFVSPEKWDFARNLLLTVLEKKVLAMDLIRPRLKNWEADRIAILDMILMRMGVCEFLFFETIPPKVTINEYIDIAKEYSTQQSGHFVNGILDNIHKELIQENKLMKVNFKASS